LRSKIGMPEINMITEKNVWEVGSIKDVAEGD
jgi:hypothetical protein